MRFLSLIVLVATQVVACSDDHSSNTCPPIGCDNGVTVMITSSGGQKLRDGRYVFDAKLDGNVVQGDCTLGPTRVECTNASLSLSRLNDSTLQLRMRATPKHVEITVLFDADPLGASVFDPAYRSYSPTEGCEPICQAADHTLVAKAPSTSSDAGTD